MATTERSAAAEAWELLQRLFHQHARPRAMALAAQHQLTPPQLGALMRLGLADDPVPMSGLARWLHCDASNVTGIVDRLESRGLVERVAAPGDRRVRMLALTPAGETLQAELSARLGEPPPGLAVLPLADQRTLRDLLRRVLGEDR